MEHIKQDNFCIKNAIKMSNWINNGGWIVICLFGGTGIIFCSFGMIVQLINIAQTEDLALFLNENKHVIKVLRIVRDLNVSQEEWDSFLQLLKLNRKNK